MTAGFLLILWIGSHLAIVLTIRDSKFRLPVFALIGISLLVVYAMKPYTYDLQMYSIYFNTGFIETLGWHSPGGKFQLDGRETTGQPFAQAFEPGFRLFAKTGNMLLPMGSLVPRVDPNVGDFGERGPPRSDAMVYLVMLLGFILLYAGAKQFIQKRDNNLNDERVRIIIAGPIIFGTVFFILGSQNSLRQFFGVSIIVWGLAMLASRRYGSCLGLILLSAAFHKWAPILGFISAIVILLGRLSNNNYSRLQILHFPIVGVTNFLNSVKRGVIEEVLSRLYPIGRFVPLPVKEICRLSPGEMLSLMFGITIIVLIKGAAVLGIFTADMPLVGDLKPYLIMGAQYESAERLGSFVKVGAIFMVFICSEFVLGRTSISDSESIRFLRRMIFVFVIPLAVYPEIFSRMLNLYWAVEVIFVVWALNSSEVRARLAASVVFIAYGFAPNAINILIGPNWLHNL